MRRLSLLSLLALLLCVDGVQAQQSEVLLGLKGGNNTLFGTYSALSIEARRVVGNHFLVRGGGQYNSYSRVAAEVRPAYYHDFDFGRLSAELLLGYVAQSKIDNYTVGGGATLDARPLWVTLGYFHRTMVRGGDTLIEPFNIYYELGLRALPRSEKWDLNIVFTNSRMFELERHYQPTYAIDGWWYPTQRVGVLLGINYKPAGMFNMSSDYFQLNAKLGVCYRW